MSDYVSAIENIMNQPRQFRPEQELTWHETAAEVFVPDDQVRIDAIAATAADIIVTFPYDQAAEAIRIAGQGAAAFRQARFYRKVFMAGRDTLRLATQTRLGDEAELSPLRFVAQPLGQVFDCQGQDQAVIELAVSSLARAQQAAPLLGQFSLRPLSPEEVRQACDSVYDIPTLTAQDPNHPVLIYHSHRKGFRRLLHLGMVSYLVAPSAEKLDYIKQGIEMNSRYGHHHEQLLATSINSSN